MPLQIRFFLASWFPDLSQKFLPRFRQRSCFHLTGDSPFIFRFERGARPVNHNNVLRTLDSNGVSDPWRNDDTDVIRAAMIVAIDEETHRPRRQARANIAKNHFRDALHEEHHVPLLVLVTAQGIIFRFLDKTAAQPVSRFGPIGSTGWVNVKTLGCLGKHARAGPLPRPETDSGEQALIAPSELSKRAPMPL